ncbi:MAG TPA: pilus assembly protein TadG-related protein [Pyrinomonadaceae bacterium]|nr:pilus assembly protein TadG-related protein [Pyrinomonadaceae bacterium]
MKAKLGLSISRKSERGSVLATSTLGMLCFLLAVGLGVDISRLYTAKTELQNAADAAALAAASGLNGYTKGITNATDRAVQVMNSYNFNKTSVVFARADVRFAKNLDDFDKGLDVSEVTASGSASVAKDIRFVKVKTPSEPVVVTFATMVLGANRNLKAEATAGMSVPLNLFNGYLPVFVVDNNDGTALVPGQMYTFRGGPQSSVSPGNYQALAIDGAGGSDDREGLASGVKRIVGAGGYVDTKPGVTSGAIRQGINTRFDDYAAGMDPAEYPPDTNIAEDISYEDYVNGSTTKSPSHTGVAGRRVVLIPIVKINQMEGGRTEVQIDRFGAFFLRSKVSGGNGGDLQAEYIGVGVVIGSGTYDPSAPANPGPPITKPVLYK